MKNRSNPEALDWQVERLAFFGARFASVTGTQESVA